MKRCILIAALTAFLTSLSLSPVNAQILRYRCAGGQCYQKTAIIQNWGVSAPNSARYAVAPCDAAQTVAPCDPVEAAEPAVEPCAPVETVEPCAPVATCASSEYIPTETGRICVGGTCPIRAAVKTSATVAKTAVKAAAASARWLLSVNKTRAAYGLAPLVCAPDLDTACAAVANNCATTATLAHGTGAEIIAYNYSGIDAACGQWLNSPAHRALLLSPSFKAAGVAVVKAQDGRFYCVVKFR